MKRSSHVSLSLVPFLSACAIAAGCGSRGGGAAWQTCVDQQNRVVDERQCQQEQRTHVGAYPWFYHWYYYPYGGNRYPMGYVVPRGGTYATEPFAGVQTGSIGVPRAGAAVPGSGGHVFGGFGSTGAGHAVGE